MPIKNNPIKSVWFTQATGGSVILAASVSARNYLVRINYTVHTADACSIEDGSGPLYEVGATAPVGSYASLGFGDGKSFSGDLIVSGGGRLSGTVEYYESV